VREPLLILGAARALMMQAAHPLVAQGVLDHSDFANDPVAALPEDRGLGDHGGIRHPRGGQGRYPRGEPAAPKGAGNATRGAHHSRQDSCSDYRAQDHSLLLWVHGSLIDALLTAYRAVVGDLSDARADRFVREWDAVANLMGLPPGSTWSSKLEMRSWIGRQVRLGWCSPAADRAGW
jgi:uncharacterized protein (DUF2236 family)